jgi:hypothetical protein
VTSDSVRRDDVAYLAETDSHYIFYYDAVIPHDRTLFQRLRTLDRNGMRRMGIGKGFKGFEGQS